jgi:hypothetical protein
MPKSVPLGLTRVPVCIPFEIPRYLATVWLPIISFECILLGLALWNGFRHIHELRLVGRWNSDNVLNVILRDSIFYFCACVLPLP